MKQILVAGLTAVMFGGSASAAFIEMQGVGVSILTSQPSPSGVIYALGDVQGTGTGTFPAFLRMETDTKSDSLPGLEDGFNTDSAQLLNDEKPGAHTHSLLFSNLGIYTDPNTLITYYEFRLDWNESNSSPDRDLKFLEFQIYSSLTGDQSNADPHLGLDGLTNTLLYSMQADFAPDFDGFHVWDANSGQGQDDFQILIPTALLSPAAGQDYLTLYAKFGASEPNGQGDVPGAAEPAFEEFSYRACASEVDGCTPPPPEEPQIPEPSTYALMGAGLLALGALGRRKRN